jgi:hypothetical protein
MSETTLFGLAAAVSSLVGVWLAVLSYRTNRKSARNKAEQETHEQLLAARAESEALSAELHRLRMKYGDEENG